MVDFPRVTLAHAPTPLEPMPRLGAELGLKNLYVKRDDCTGLAMGRQQGPPAGVLFR